LSESAVTQTGRIVSMVAELTQRADRGEADMTVDEIARRFDTTPAQVRHDVVALTAASEDAQTDWLSSITIEQEGDRLSVTSRGPFRRPVRLTSAELTAIQIGLAMESDPPPPMARALADLLGDTPAPAIRALPQGSDREARVLDLARRALDERLTLQVKYAGARDRVGVDRIIEPHEVVYEDGNYYLIAFCRKADDWRRFRADRVLDAALGADRFEPRDPPPPVLFAHQEPDPVQVRFAPAIARWIRERYPDAREDGDGSVVVTYQVADPQWLVRTVLQYGADAEVVGPEEYRTVMRMSLRD